MTRWNLVIPEETDRAVRSYLAINGGKKGDLSKFVNDAVRERVFFETVSAIQKQNADLSTDEAEALANEAVAWVRADRS